MCILKATVEPMQIDTGPEDSDANRVMVESTTLVNVYTLVHFLVAILVVDTTNCLLGGSYRGHLLFYWMVTTTYCYDMIL